MGHLWFFQFLRSRLGRNLALDFQHLSLPSIEGSREKSFLFCLSLFSIERMEGRFKPIYALMARFRGGERERESSLFYALLVKAELVF
jgi:hypothetical protein